MAQSNYINRLEVLVDVLSSTAEAKAGDLRVVRSNGLMALVRFEHSHLGIVLLPDSVDLTPKNVVDAANTAGLTWMGYSTSGTLVLSVNPPATVFRSRGAAALPKDIAVMSFWGEENKLIYRGANSLLKRLSDLARLHFERPDEQAPVGPPDSRSPIVQSPSTPANLSSVLPSPGVPASRPVTPLARPGTTLDAYRLDEILGRGASAEVWRATVVSKLPFHELPVNSTVAIKLYTGGLLDSAQPLRIHREFMIASRIQHPHVGRVYDMMLAPSRPLHQFMVMEYIPGRTLKDHIASSGSLSAHQTVKLGQQLFSAVSEVHAHRAKHRDIKAANIMLVGGGVDPIDIRLLDLGIVELSFEHGLTATSVFLGSKHTAPLEQLRGQELDDRADIYSAASVLFNCLRGVPPYNDQNTEGDIVFTMMNSPEVLDPIDAGIDDGTPLIDFINLCMSVDRRNRPTSADECLRNLNEIERRMRSN